MTIYDFKIKDYQGNEIDFNQYKGKVLLIVNTATKCGHTPQYEQIQKFYEENYMDGFEVLDFPCNQFFKQAPGTSQEIHEACVLRFGIKFRQFEKIEVNGVNRHPLYQYLIDNCLDNKGKRIQWNFTKFLIDKNGNVIHRYEPKQKIEDFKQDIIDCLNK